MILLKSCRNVFSRLLVILIIISSLAVPPAFCQETEDSQVFIAGFNAYQQKDYPSSIEKMNEVLQKFPDTPLRDMALFWLSRSYYKVGNQQEAAHYLSQLSKEYPDSPLKNTVEDELLALTDRYEKGEKLPGGATSVKQPDLLAAQKTKAEKERITTAKAEEVKRATAVAAADAARLAALKQAEEKRAADKKEVARAAAAKVEQERLAGEVAAETARISAQRSKAEQLAQVQAEQKRVVQAEAEVTRMNALTAENERKEAIEKNRREQLALEKAEESKKTAVAAEAARLAAVKAEEARKTDERIAATEAENRRMALHNAQEIRVAQQKLAEEKSRAEKAAYREKAIAQYKAIIDTYPASTAAVAAASKLRDLGIAVALPPQVAAEAPLAENAQVLRLEVAQFAGFEFNMLARPDTFTVALPITVPFEVINRGNGKDSFALESSFPAVFNARFASASAPAVAISHTPDLAPGETFKGIINLTIPPESIDGLRILHPVKATSRLMAEASQSREVRLAASAPLLRAVLRTEKARPLPGDTVLYRIAVLNAGSTGAEKVTFRLNFPPQLEPVDYAGAGFRQESKSALVLDGLQLKSGESREFTVAFHLKDDSLAGEELSTRAELINNPLKTSAAFVSNSAYVEARRSVAVRVGSDRLVAIPGQTLAIPFIVTNSGNIREKFKISTIVSGAKDALVFNDVNRDGIRQAAEPVITEIGPLAPHEEASVLVEIATPKSAADTSQGSVRISFVSEGDSTRSASGSAQLIYSRPLLTMVMAGRDGRLKPGDVASFDLTITNNGSNLARIVELQSAWPEQLELVAADPVTSAVSNSTIIWQFKEMGAGEKRSIKVSFRVKPGTGVGTALQVKNILTYEDQLGNRY